MKSPLPWNLGVWAADREDAIETRKSCTARPLYVLAISLKCFDFELPPNAVKTSLPSNQEREAAQNLRLT